MRAALTPTAIGIALWIAASPSQAVGFGRITNATQLGQPLNFAAVVRLEGDEALPRECVSAEVQSGDNKLQPQQVRVTLEPGADPAERRVRVTSSALIDEPVVTVSVTVGCTGKVTRRFVAFVDPPLIDMPRTAQAEAGLPPQRIDSQVAPIVSIVQGGDNPPPRDPDRLRPRIRSSPVPVAVAAAAPSGDAPAARPARRQAATPHRAYAARAPASGARLQLDPAASLPAAVAAASAPTAPSAFPVAGSATASAPAAAPVPTLASSPALPAPDAASAASAAEAAARDRQRIQALEEGLAKMRSDTQAAQAAVAALQLRLQQAESDRYANPMVYALAWLSALLALALAAFWWRQSRGRQSTQWWAGPAPAPAPSSVRLAGAAEQEISAPQPLGAPITAADAFDVSTVVEDEPVPPSHVSLSTRPAPFVSSRLAPLTLSPEPPRELSVEELIDLEQQAEFFVVLGQDDAAIELLMNHVRSDGGISPLPYLKLLEIYRRLGDRDAYQRIRERFNRRFNAYAPDWDADLQQGRSLADYPDTMVRLQALWSSPRRVMETLDASLFRRNRTDETFDLPAYRELLFLFSMARDLAEHAGAAPATGVDLLLPLGEPGEEPIARLTATTQAGDFQSSDMMTLPLDLDVSFGDAGASSGMVDRPPAAPPGTNLIDFDLDAPTAAEPRKH